MSKTLYLVLALVVGGVMCAVAMRGTRSPRSGARSAGGSATGTEGDGPARAGGGGTRYVPRAPVAADRADPKSVVVAFATALTSGDKATARKLSVGTPRQLDYLDAQVDDYTAFNHFDAMLAQKFKDDASFYIEGYDKLPDSAKDATIKPEEEQAAGDKPEGEKPEGEKAAGEKPLGDKATAVFYFMERGTFMAWKLVKRDGQWSVDASSLRDPGLKPDQDTPERLRQHVEATNDLIRRLAAGQFRSAEATMEAWEEAHGKIDDQ